MEAHSQGLEFHGDQLADFHSNNSTMGHKVGHQCQRLQTKNTEMVLMICILLKQIDCGSLLEWVFLSFKF